MTPTARPDEPDFSGPTARAPRPPEWDRHPVDGAGPDDDEEIEAEFYGHADALGVPHPDGKQDELDD